MALSTFEQSPLTALGATLTFDVPASWPHCYVTVQFYDGDDEVDAASAGTLAVQYRALGSGALEDPPVATIDATAPTAISWDCPVTQVVVTPSSLADVTHYLINFISFQG